MTLLTSEDVAELDRQHDILLVWEFIRLVEEKTLQKTREVLIPKIEKLKEQGQLDLFMIERAIDECLEEKEE